MTHIPLSEQPHGEDSAPSLPVLLPERYQTEWDRPFRDAIAANLRPGVAILDVGSGRNPSIPREDRPPGTTYAGLDLSAAELEAAAPGAYDESVVSDAGMLRDELVGRFDLVVSWQVFEHVENLGATLVCMQSYLRPGGSLVAMFSGGRSAFALANRVLPFHVGKPLVTKVMGRSSANPVFPAYYDRCTASALEKLLAGWTASEITPFFRGAEYFRFSAAATKAYVLYENWALARDASDLATHYLVVATR